MAARRRLDVEMVRRGLADSRTAAKALIDAGRVRVGGAPADKAGRLVDPGDAVVVDGPPRRFVSRGGDKLDGALDALGVDVTGARALDAGASTGGFTDCLLQRGAASVVAADVGRGQLHERIASDARVVVRDRCNVRTLTEDELGGRVDVVVADLSFIGLGLVLPALLGCAGADADLVVLVKPQFEAGRADVGRGRGVVRDPDVWRRVLHEVIDAAVAAGATIMGAVVSPLPGADGNVEFFLHLRRAGSVPTTLGPDAVDRLVAQAAALAGAGR